MSRDSTLSFWVEKLRLYLWFCISGSFYNKHSERARDRKVSDRPQQQWNSKLAPDLNAMEGVALRRTHFITPNNDKCCCTPQLCDDWIILCVETLICLLYFLSTSTLQHKKTFFPQWVRCFFYLKLWIFFPMFLLHAIFVCFTKCLCVGICLFVFTWYDFVLTLFNFCSSFICFKIVLSKSKWKQFIRLFWQSTSIFRTNDSCELKAIYSSEWKKEKMRHDSFKEIFFYKSKWNCMFVQAKHSPDYGSIHRFVWFFFSPLQL